MDILVSDPELFDKVVKGNLSAQKKEQLAKSISEGKQGILPGMGDGTGGLFDQEPEPKATPEPKKEKSAT